MNPVLVKQELHRLLQNNQLEKAREICDSLCEFVTDDIEAWLISASISSKLGDFHNVLDCCNKVIKLQPSHVLAHYNLGIAHQRMGNYASAEDAYRTTLQLNPAMRLVIVSLGNVVMNQGRAEESLTFFNMVLHDTHSDVTVKLKAYINLSLALCMLKRFSEAAVACENGLRINPDSAEALNNLGRVLKEQGDLNGAVNAHRKAVNINPESSIVHSNLLLDLNYLADIDDTEIFSEHCKWGQQHAAFPLTKKLAERERNPDKRLRVGYVSPDFRAHSVILFVSGLIESHNRNNVEVYCYSNVKNSDAWTEHISKVTDHWREINKITDDQLVTMVEQDEIDILIDLSGHTADNRLITFSQKPAPIQATWLGYPNTTGLTAIDYRLSDVWADPPGVSDTLYTETLVRLPHGFLCYTPLKDSPAVNDLPMTGNGGVTFGCFNNSAKINDDVIALWCRLLHEVANSRLLLKSAQFSDLAIRDTYLSKFEQAGINLKRIDIYGRIDSTIDHLSLYNRVDVALDTFPYNGTTTTCEALWMGVPVVVLEGVNHAGRVGVSLLNNIGLPEMIANKQDDYVRICSNLAKDPEHLSKLRLGMRERMTKAPLLDAVSFAEDIEQAYRKMWAKYCD